MYLSIAIVFIHFVFAPRYNIKYPIYLIHLVLLKYLLPFVSVESSSKSDLDGGEFDHLITYSLACTFESEIVSARKYESICFGSINEVIDEDDLECLNVEKTRRMGGIEEGSTSRARMARSSLNAAGRQ